MQKYSPLTPANATLGLRAARPSLGGGTLGLALYFRPSFQPEDARIGSERLIFRPDIWRQDPQLDWYAIGFNTARSAAMYVFANSLV